jgi:hypothetical protein
MTYINGIQFSRAKVVTIPEWAREIHLVANAIDGHPPYGLEAQYMVRDFLWCAKNQVNIQTLEGGGEWDCLIYAVRDSDLVREAYPYGPHNGYRVLRSKKGGRVKLIAQMSYMRDTFYHFVKPTTLKCVSTSE